MLKALWNGRKIYSAPYPVVGAASSGNGNFIVDLVKQGIKDTVDTLSIHIVGSIVPVGAGGVGTASGQPNPQALLEIATLNTSPQAAGLIPINAISARGAVVDEAFTQGTFDTAGVLANNATGTAIPVDFWQHYRFKRPGVKKAVEYAMAMTKWKSALLTINMGTVDQLFTGATQTWNFNAVTVEVWVDMDIDAQPDQIHATELFEQLFPIQAANPAFIINTLPQGCFYDTLYLIAEDVTTGTNLGVPSDAIITNIDIEGGGRQWLPQGDSNATFVRNRYTRPLMYDRGNVNSLVGIYALPLRDGLWSRALDASSTPIVIKLAVNGPAGGHVFNIRLVGRKLVPGGVKKTTKGAGGAKVVSGLQDA